MAGTKKAKCGGCQEVTVQKLDEGGAGDIVSRYICECGHQNHYENKPGKGFKLPSDHKDPETRVAEMRAIGAPEDSMETEANTMCKRNPEHAKHRGRCAGSGNGKKANGGKRQSKKLGPKVRRDTQLTGGSKGGTYSELLEARVREIVKEELAAHRTQLQERVAAALQGV